LEGVRNFDDADQWAAFDRIYRPLLVRYARQQGLNRGEAEEIAQQCLEIIVRNIRGFRRRRSFRAWLRRIVQLKVYQHLRRRARDPLPLHGDPEAVQGVSPAEEWERQWTRTHLMYCVASVKGDFAPHTYRAFELYVLQSVPVEQITQALGMTRGQVYVAKARVMRRVRERFAEMLETWYGDGK